jgi:molybdate transport system regulatory protein
MPYMVQQMKIKSKIWFESEKGMILSQGRVDLLKHIEQTGSLNKAAKAMNLSYQKAWKLLEISNEATEKPLVETKIGGAKGGGTQLTDYGKQLILAYESINQECWKFLEEQLQKHTI